MKKWLRYGEPGSPVWSAFHCLWCRLDFSL